MIESKNEIDPAYIPRSLIVFDSAIFIFFIIVGFIYLIKVSRRYNLSAAFVFFLAIYIVLSYSSYNLMVMPIHDFNIPIPRTFIYHYKVFSSFSPLDLLSIGFLFTLLGRWMVCKKNPLSEFSSTDNSDSVIKIVAIQGLLVLLVSFVGYITYSINHGVVSIKNQIVYFRGVIYFFIFIFLYKTSIDELKKNDLKSMLMVFCVIDFINFISGLISTLVYTDFVWERYGIKVTIIDQDKIYNYFTLYLFVIVSLFFSKKIKPSVALVLAVIIATCMLFNVYKFLFAIGFLYLLYEISVRSVLRNVPLKRMILLMVIAIGLAPPAFKIFTSKPINTRASQLNDYWDYTGKYFPANLFGIGYGGFYLSPTGVADKGEIKKIDEDADGNVKYKRSIQSPILTHIKSSGIIGLSIMIVSGFIIFRRVLAINVRLSLGSFTTPICFNLIWMVGGVCIVLQPYPMPALTFVKLLFLLSMLISEKENGLS